MEAWGGGESNSFPSVCLPLYGSVCFPAGGVLLSPVGVGLLMECKGVLCVRFWVWGVLFYLQCTVFFVLFSLLNSTPMVTGLMYDVHLFRLFDIMPILLISGG